MKLDLNLDVANVAVADGQTVADLAQHLIEQAAASVLGQRVTAKQQRELTRIFEAFDGAEGGIVNLDASQYAQVVVWWDKRSLAPATGPARRVQAALDRLLCSDSPDGKGDGDDTTDQ